MFTWATELPAAIAHGQGYTGFKYRTFSHLKKKVFFFTHGCPVEVEPKHKWSHQETEVCFSIAFLNNLNTVISACGSADGYPTRTLQDIEQFLHRHWVFKEEFINLFLFLCLPSSPKLLRKTCEPRCPGVEVERAAPRVKAIWF